MKYMSKKDTTTHQDSTDAPSIKKTPDDSQLPRGSQDAPRISSPSITRSKGRSDP